MRVKETACRCSSSGRSRPSARHRWPIWSSRSSTSGSSPWSCRRAPSCRRWRWRGSMGVSRQPVRDAFYRLSRLGFLTIWPQRATIVAPISERAVLQARFIRTAIELETVQAAARMLDARPAPAPADARPAPGSGDGGRREAPLPRARRRVPPPDLRVRRPLLRLDGDQGEQGAHGPGALSEPVLRGAERLRRSRRRSWRRCRRTIRQKAAEAMRVHLSRIGGIIATIREERDEYFAKEAV